MKDDRVLYFATNMDKLSRRDRVFLNNPVIMQGMGLAAIVVPAYNLQNAIIMVFAMALLLTPTRMIATFIGQRVNDRLRPFIYVITSGLVFIMVSYLTDVVFGSDTLSVGIYLPLLVMEPLVLKRYYSPKKERLSTSFKKGMATTLGFSLAILLIGALREVLAYGTLMGAEVASVSLLPIAAMPAGGFIITGLVAAIWRSLVYAFKKRVSLEAKNLL